MQGLSAPDNGVSGALSAVDANRCCDVFTSPKPNTVAMHESSCNRPKRAEMLSDINNSFNSQGRKDLQNQSESLIDLKTNGKSTTRITPIVKSPAMAVKAKLGRNRTNDITFSASDIRCAHTNTNAVTETCGDDVDSRDTSPVQDPIHCFRTSAAGSESPFKPTGKSFETQQHSMKVPVNFHPKSRLTLSAFRRPEQTIRLTQADPSRSLAAEYDLHGHNCGVLGHGAFSTVRLAIRRKDGVKVAVKSIAKHEALRSRRLRLGGRSYLEEWEILRRLQHHPYVIDLLDILESDDEIQLVTEFCEGGELFDAIQRRRNKCLKRRGQYSEMQAARITSQVLRALKDLHAMNIVHRDVKPENILLTNNDEANLHVKLCDFGVARPLCLRKHVHTDSNSSTSDGESSPLTPGRSRSFSAIGTDYYAAPEIVYGGTYDTAADIYSLGVTLYILLCGFPPVFSGEDSDEVVFPSSYWEDISSDAKELLRSMLAPDAAERISAQEALMHQWIRDKADVNENISVGSNASLAMSSPPLTLKHQVDLNLVRNQLLLSLNSVVQSETPLSPRPSSTLTSKRSFCDILSPGASKSPAKRGRYERRSSSAFLALADLYREVTATPSGMTAASIAVDSPPSTPRPLEDVESSSASVGVAELSAEQHDQSLPLATLSF